jgi:hypothetical protein
MCSQAQSALLLCHFDRSRALWFWFEALTLIFSTNGHSKSFFQSFGLLYLVSNASSEYSH